MAYYNCSNLHMCLKQRIGSTIFAPFQDTHWLSNAAAAIGSSWHGQALPPPILLLLELAQISASHSLQAGRLQPEFPESSKHTVHSTLTNYIIHWAYTVAGAVNLGTVPKQATSWPRVWPQLDIPVEFRPHWNISGFEFFSPLSLTTSIFGVKW